MKTYKLWARVGMTVEVTDEEKSGFYQIQKNLSKKI